MFITQHSLEIEKILEDMTMNLMQVVMILLGVCFVNSTSHNLAAYLDRLFYGCKQHERYCSKDSRCISDQYWCDGYVYVAGPDCSDGEDESKCSGMALGTKCSDITIGKECHEKECANHGLNHCSTSSRCFHKRERCDGKQDCPNGYDEHNCQDFQCLEGYLKCNDFTCRLGSRCDGIKQCPNGEDEAGCQDFQCKRYQMKCKDLSCSFGEICDGYVHCRDGSDESNCKDYVCPAGKVKCADDTCAWGDKCDGWTDCLDKSDEFQCNGLGGLALRHFQNEQPKRNSFARNDFRRINRT